MSAATAMPGHQANWIAEQVLTRTYIKSCGGVELIRLCDCQYGPCGHCGQGNHAKCSTRRHPELSRLHPHTRVVGPTGAALTDVWTAGAACRWVCPCNDPAHSTPVADESPTPAVRRTPGGLRPGDVVWLTAQNPLLSAGLLGAAALHRRRGQLPVHRGQDRPSRVPHPRRQHPALRSGGRLRRRACQAEAASGAA